MYTINRYFLLLLMGILIILVICPGPASAISVVGAKYMETVNAGDTVTHTMTVSTKATDPSMDIVVDVLGFEQTKGKSYSPLSAADDASPDSARKFITLDTGSFHLNPGESKNVTATIVIPEDAGDGERYAIISIHNTPAGVGTTPFITAISVPVTITITQHGHQKGTAEGSGKHKNPKPTIGLSVSGTQTFGDKMLVGDNVNTTANTVRTTVISNVPWILTVRDDLSISKPVGTAGYMAEWDGISAYTVKGKVLTTPFEVSEDGTTYVRLTGSSLPLLKGNTAGTFVNHPYFKQTIVLADTRVAIGHSYGMVVTFDVRAT